MAGWVETTLGDICHVYQPQTLAQKQLRSGPVPVYGANGQIGWHDEFNHEGGQLLLGCRGSVGFVHITTERAWINGNAMVVIPKEGVIERDFLAYALRGGVDLSASVTGAAQPQITRTSLNPISITFPADFGEQCRIAAILDEAFEGIVTAKANAEKNLQNARELFTSALANVFNTVWPRVRIEDACESIMDCVNKTAPIASEPTPYKMLRTTNIRHGLVSLSSVNCVSEDVYKIWTRRQVPRRGDVILTREAPMGEVGMLESDEAVFLGQRLVSYRADTSKLDGRFLLYALQSDPLQRQIRAKASGSTVQHMRVPDSKNLQLPLPDLAEQKKAVERLDSMREDANRLRVQYSRKLAALDELKKSLLHQAFTGQL